MTRVTRRDTFGNGIIRGVDPNLGIDLGDDVYRQISDAMDRLAAYEDTGLLPPEVAKLLLLCDMRTLRADALAVADTKQPYNYIGEEAVGCPFDDPGGKGHANE